MKFGMLLAATALVATAATAAPQVKHPPKTPAAAKTEAKAPAKEFFKPAETRSTGSVMVGGQPINYDAIAGTLVVHAKEWQDTDAVEADASPDKGKDSDGP